jgi:hypothetical protein
MTGLAPDLQQAYEKWQQSKTMPVWQAQRLDLAEHLRYGSAISGMVPATELVSSEIPNIL